MSVRCQVGDLALVVRGFPQNIGKLVTCLELVPTDTLVSTSAGVAYLMCDCPIWRIDRSLSYTATNGAITEVPFAGDDALMPVRPERDEDLDRVKALSDAGFVGVDTREIHATKSSQV